jgi:hypothetical protein
MTCPDLSFIYPGGLVVASSNLVAPTNKNKGLAQKADPLFRLIHKITPQLHQPGISNIFRIVKNKSIITVCYIIFCLTQVKVCVS